MKLKLIAIFCMFLIITSSLGISVDSQTERSVLSDLYGSEEETGESIVINVDFIEPTVLTTDVIEGQNAPVYIHLKGTTLGGFIFGSESPKNTPFYGLPKIKSVNIVPADADTRKYFSGYQYVRPSKGQYISNDGLIDLGYLIVVLKRIPKEGDVPDKITLAFDADVRFDLESGFGNFGAEDLVLKEQANEQVWKQNLPKDKTSSFWGSTGLVRASRIDQNSVSLVIYNGMQQPISSLTLKRGDPSSPITLRSNLFTVYDRFRVKLESINVPTDKVSISVLKNGETPQKKLLSIGQRLYSGSNWKVIEIKPEFQLFENSQAVVKDGKNVYVTQVIIRNDKGEVKALNLKSLGNRLSSTSSVIRDPHGTIVGVPNGFTQPMLEAYLKLIADNLLEEQGGTFFDLGQKYDIDPSFAIAVAIHESSAGRSDVAKQNNNYFGITINGEGTGFRKYNSPKESIEEFYKLIKNNYISNGQDTPNKIACAPGSGFSTHCYVLSGRDNWVKNVPSFRKDILDIISINAQYAEGETKIQQSSIIDCSDVDVSDDIVSKLGNYKNDDVNVLKKKTFCKTVNELRDVIALSPESKEADEAYYYLGKAYGELNNYKEARTAYSLISSQSVYYDHALLAIKEIDLLESSGVEVDKIYLQDEDVYLTLNNVIRLKGEDSPIAYISIKGGQAQKFIKDQTFISDAKDERQESFNWVIDEVNANNVIVKRYYFNREGTNKYSDFTTLTTTSIKNLVTNGKDGLTSVQVTNIDTNQEARITILPGTGREVSRSSFNVHIPINKRPFQFTPEQIDSQIAKTREIISKLNSIIEKLDNAIRVWTTLCFGVYGVLIVKNFFTSPIKVKAREQVMHGVDGRTGWSKFCSDNSGVGKTYINYDECIFDNEETISKQIGYAETYVEEKQKTLKNNGLGKKSELVGENYVSGETLAEEKALEEYINNLKSSNMNSKILNEQIKILEQNQININDEIGFRTGANTDAENYIKDIKDYEKLDKVERLQIYNSVFQQSLDTKRKREIKEPIAEITPFIGVKNRENPNTGAQEQFYYTYDAGGEKTLTPANKLEYLAYLKNLESSTLNPTLPSQNPEDYDENAKKLKIAQIKEQIREVEKLSDNSPIIASSGKTVYKQSDGKFVVGYNEQYVNQAFKIRRNYAVQRIEYYEDGSPFCVPTGNGNYVKVLEYYANKQPKTIAEWNVGPNGIICDEDDIPITSEDVLKLPDRESQSNSLKRTVNSAGFCKSGERSLEGLNGKWACSIARAAFEQQITQLHCTDSMDILDCKILFNVCDPVMCPSSRFDLGGRWKLGRRSVAETGLIGSLVLGLPNFVGFGGSDVIPICLTGVSAGLKNWRSVFQGYEQCLQVSKTQDKSVGICNQVRSVFMCEILWKEGLAILDVNKGLLSLGVEAIYGGLGEEGGGEYANFRDSFDNTANSFKFFSQEYARSAFAAYEARSTDEIGTEICKAAIFSKSPGIGKFFEDLTSPESPPQFTAFFDSTIYSSQAGLTRENANAGLLSSIQEQSKYNIYYHIYAGEDREVYYSVFLADRFRSLRPLYVTECENPLAVRRPISRGAYVDNSCTKIAATGYNQVCVEINGRVECGFGKVTSSFGLDYIQDEIVRSEALDFSVNSTEECRPNNPTFTSQYGFDSGSGKQYGVLNTGIVRVCNPSNPGQGTNSNNWESVGVCTRDSQGNVLSNCWLDKTSIDINNLATDAEVRKKLDEQGLIKDGLISEDEAKNDLERLNTLFNELFEIKGSAVTVKEDIAKEIAGDNTNNALARIQEIIQYKDATKLPMNYRYVILKSPNIDVISEGRIKIAQAYYALGNLLVANKNALNANMEEKINFNLGPTLGEGYNFKISDIEYTIYFLGIRDDEINLEIRPEQKKLTLKFGESKTIDLNNDDINDIIIKVGLRENNNGGIGLIITKLQQKNEVGVKKQEKQEIIQEKTPIEIKLVRAYDAPLFGNIDWMQRDIIYIWDGKQWKDNGAYSPDPISKINVNDFNGGLNFIYKKILDLNDGLLTKVEATCGGDNNRFLILKERFNYGSLEDYFNNIINKCNINQKFQIGSTQTSGQEQKKTLTVETARGTSSKGIVIEVNKQQEGSTQKEPIKDAQVTAKTESKPLNEEKVVLNLKPIKYEIAPLQSLKYDLSNDISLPLQEVKVIELEFNTPEMASQFEQGFQISPGDEKEIFVSQENEQNIVYESKSKNEGVEVEIDIEGIKKELLERNLDEVIDDLDSYVVHFEKTTATNEEGKTSINLEEKDAEIVISEKNGNEVSRILLSEILKEQLTCTQINSEQSKKSKSEGSVFSCNPSSSCRIGAAFNKGQLDCGQGSSCCRVTCEVAYPGFQCTDTNKFNCEGETKKGYCPGTNEVLCCKRGSAKTTTFDYGFTIYPDINQKILGIIQGNKEYAENLKICEGINCAGYTSATFDYIFGAGRRFITGAFGNAWNLPASVEERNGESTFYDRNSGELFTNYDSLNPGDILGLHYTESHFKPNELYKDLGEGEAKYGWQRGNTPEIDFTHAALYLGKYNGKHYITHFIHDEGAPKVETIENLLLKRYPGKMFIRAVMKINYDSLYKPVPTYSTNNYVVKEGDSIRSISYSLSNGLSADENSWLIANYNKIYEPNYLEAGKTIKVPGKDLISTQNIRNINDVSGNLAKKINNKYEKDDNDDFGLKWSMIIYTNAKYKTPEYLSLIASIIDTETSFNTQTSETTQQTLFDYTPDFLKDSFFTNAGKDMGCMDIKLCKAINIEKEIGNKNDPEDVVYDKITTDEGCVYYGEQYLRRISEPFLKDDNTLTKEKINYILSEYVAGEYSSRNAAFQKQVSELTGLQLDLDGDLLIYNVDCTSSDSVSNTERATRLIISNNNFGITNSDLRNMLLKEKSKNFESTDIYKKIKTLYKKELNTDPEYLILPNAARYSNLGTSKDKLSISFVNDVLPNYNLYCSEICKIT